jgi:hypothetical protein
LEEDFLEEVFHGKRCGEGGIEACKRKKPTAGLGLLFLSRANRGWARLDTLTARERYRVVLWDRVR